MAYDVLAKNEMLGHLATIAVKVKVAHDTTVKGIIVLKGWAPPGSGILEAQNQDGEVYVAQFVLDPADTINKFCVCTNDPLDLTETAISPAIEYPDGGTFTVTSLALDLNK